jgi:hypothetical protein
MLGSIYRYFMEKGLELLIDANKFLILEIFVIQLYLA